jgi:hypothetical protein
LVTRFGGGTGEENQTFPIPTTCGWSLVPKEEVYMKRSHAGMEAGSISMTSSGPAGPPGDLHTEIEGHLLMIEAQYPLSIRNKEYVIERIMAKTTDTRLILTIAFSLNHWVAVNRISGDVIIPERILDQILGAVR